MHGAYRYFIQDFYLASSTYSYCRKGPLSQIKESERYFGWWPSCPTSLLTLHNIVFFHPVFIVISSDREADLWAGGSSKWESDVSVSVCCQAWKKHLSLTHDKKMLSAMPRHNSNDKVSRMKMVFITTHSEYSSWPELAKKTLYLTFLVSFLTLVFYSESGKWVS